MFIDFIPVEYYTLVFYNALLTVIFFTFIRLLTKGYVLNNFRKKEYISFMLLLSVVFYMGLRPISGKYFIDMGMYNYEFEQYASGGEINANRDYLWHLFMKFCSGIMTANIFFLVCAILYVLPLYKASKNWFGKDRYFLFLMFVASLSFWAYGTNGIRNGIATSVFVLALSKKNNIFQKDGLLILSFFIHGSMVIPISAYILSSVYKNPKHYIFGWFLCVVISLIFGGMLESFIANIGFGDDRSGYLTMRGFENRFSFTGFRWDFLLYSFAPIFMGYYFIVSKKFEDKIYTQLFNIYVASNAFWVLVIRSAYSNRFSYLSWFLMAPIVFYPFLKSKLFKKQQKVLALTIVLYYGFTYIVFLVS